MARHEKGQLVGTTVNNATAGGENGENTADAAKEDMIGWM
jgi:hypothetical protein